MCSLLRAVSAALLLATIGSIAAAEGRPAARAGTAASSSSVADRVGHSVRHGLEWSKQAITRAGLKVEHGLSVGLRATGRAIHRAGEKIDTKA